MPKSEKAYVIKTLDELIGKLTTGDKISNSTDRKKIKEALTLAHEMYKFEVEIYWKRATYFWGFSVVAFTAYFIVADTSKFKDRPELLLLVNAIGVVFSFSLYMVSKGGKYWQNNWYFIIIALEDSLGIPVYSFKRQHRHKFMSLLGAYPISFTKIHQIINLFIVAIWVYLVFAYLDIHYFKIINVNGWNIFLVFFQRLYHNLSDSILLLITILTMISMRIFGCSKLEKNEIMFRLLEIQEP